MQEKSDLKNLESIAKEISEEKEKMILGAFGLFAGVTLGGLSAKLIEMNYLFDDTRESMYKLQQYFVPSQESFHPNYYAWTITEIGCGIAVALILYGAYIIGKSHLKIYDYKKTRRAILKQEQATEDLTSSENLTSSRTAL